MIILYVIGGLSILIGLWAFLGLARAMVKEGGPVQLARKWLQAVSGKQK